jgi:hypothetical protein
MPKSVGTFAEVLRQNGYNTEWSLVTMDWNIKRIFALSAPN